MEYRVSSEWNGMENLKNGMEDGRPYFHTNYIYGIYIKTYKKLRRTTKLEGE